MKKSDGRIRVGRYAWVYVFAAAMIAHFNAFALGDDASAQRLVDSIYGADLKRVTATPTRDDDVELAKRMLASAEEIPGNPAAAGLMCEHALRLVESISTLRPTAIKAAKKLYELAPHKRTAALDTLIELYEDETRAQRGDARREVAQKLLSTLERAAAHAKHESRYRDTDKYYRRALGIAGIADPQRRPWLLEQTRSLREMLSLVAEADRLMADLKADPQDRVKGARVVRVLLELDRTEEARKYSFLATERTAEMIKLAAAPFDELDAKQTLLVADWYTELATNALAEPAAMKLKWRALQRYQRLADAQSVDAATRQRVTLTASKLRKDLGPDLPDDPAIAGGAGGDGGTDTALMKSIERLTERYRDWVVRDGVVMMTQDARGSVTSMTRDFVQSAEKSYTVSCEIRWHNPDAVAGLHVCGTRHTALLFTHGQNAVLLALDGRPHKVALDQVPAVGQWHKFVVHVVEKDETMTLQLVVNKVVVMNWKGPARDLSATVVQGGEKPIGGVGIVAQKANTEFRNLAIKTRSGTFKMTPRKERP